MADTLTKPISFEEFLNFDEDISAEWVGGTVVDMSAASSRHQQLVSFLLKLLDTYAEEKDLGTTVPAPIIMKLANRPSGREPDLMYIAKENLTSLKQPYLDGPADLVVEIISIESQARDRGDKYYEYEQAGIKEYWLIDPLRNQAEFYQLDGKGIYQPASLDNGLYSSRVLRGLNLEVEWLWQDPLPKLLDVLKTWDLL